MRKFLVLILAFMIAISLFAGCSQKPVDSQDSTKKVEKTDAKEETKPEEPKGPAPGVYPIEGGYEFDYWVEMSNNAAPHYENFGETPFYKKVFENTGVKLNFQHPPIGPNQAKEALNLLIASGDYPDIMEYNWVDNYPGGPAKAMNDGFMLDLTDKIPTYAPALYAYLQSLPQVDRLVKTDEGQRYCFPFMRDVSESDALLVFFGPIIRQNFLDELDMDVPETMDDWYNMLTAFKNDLGVETPLTYQWWMRNSAHNFISAYGVINDFYLDEGEIKFGPVEPEFKDYLVEFNKWFEEGLIDPDIATVDKSQVTAKITGGTCGATLGYTASRLGSWTQSMKEKDPSFKLIGAPHPVLNKGDVPMYGQKDLPFRGLSAIITDKCQDPEVAMIFMDYLYTEEGHMLVNFGIEGESYEWVDDYPTYTDLIMEHPEGWPVNEAMGAYNRANSSGPFVQDVRYFINNYVRSDYQLEAVDIWSKTDVDKHQLPPLSPTPEESEEYAAIMSDINTYRDEMLLKYIFGQESLDTFDDYVTNIKKMGLDRAIELRQAALDRFNAR